MYAGLHCMPKFQTGGRGFHTGLKASSGNADNLCGTVQKKLRQNFDQDGRLLLNSRGWRLGRMSMEGHPEHTVSHRAGGAGCAGRGTFTAAVEVQEQRQMVVSFLYHMAVQRGVRNPFEARDAAAIVNYVDVGLQARLPPLPRHHRPLPLPRHEISCGARHQQLESDWKLAGGLRTHLPRTHC